MRTVEQPAAAPPPGLLLDCGPLQLALTSIERVREEDDIVLHESAGSFILEPFAEEIVRQAREEAERSAAAAIERARPPSPVVVPTQPAANAPQAAPGAPFRVVESGR